MEAKKQQVSIVDFNVVLKFNTRKSTMEKMDRRCSTIDSFDVVFVLLIVDIYYWVVEWHALGGSLLVIVFIEKLHCQSYQISQF